jgi:hypothetical protein
MGEPVVPLFGTNGQESQMSAALTPSGELRYVLSGEDGGGGRGMTGGSSISDWLAQSCSVVTDISSNGTLYDCAN